MYKRVLATVAAFSMAVFSIAFAATQFSDVPSGHWAEPSIIWASDNGIMTGPGDMPGMFDPAGVVNRAQLATVLERYDMMVQEEMDAMKVEMEAMMDAKIAGGEVVVEEVSYMADLDGAQEVPSVTTDATGTAALMLTDDDLSYSISVSGLSGDVTGAHFHAGLAGENGDIIHTIVFDGMMAEGMWMDLTQEQMDTLNAEGYYINVHTAANPGGEIRGQVVADTSV